VIEFVAIVDGITIGSKGSWKNDVTVECKLSWAWL
jgi:hypothetical protein